MDTSENIITSTVQQDVTVAVPEDRLSEFYALYARFLAHPRGEGRRGERRGGRGPGRHDHGPGRHGHGPGRHGHGCRSLGDEARSTVETGDAPEARTR